MVYSTFVAADMGVLVPSKTFTVMVQPGATTGVAMSYLRKLGYRSILSCRIWFGNSG
jgi:hypothetical protein